MLCAWLLRWFKKKQELFSHVICLHFWFADTRQLQVTAENCVCYLWTKPHRSQSGKFPKLFYWKGRAVFPPNKWNDFFFLNSFFQGVLLPLLLLLYDISSFRWRPSRRCFTLAPMRYVCTVVSYLESFIFWTFFVASLKIHSKLCESLFCKASSSNSLYYLLTFKAVFGVTGRALAYEK